MHRILTHDQELFQAVTAVYAEEERLERDTHRPTSNDAPMGWSPVDRRFINN
ncbi:MAG: hypothetical protein JNL74_22925 [Fibrobacteres bacterium]|nr:hypothetical protein [Fibrobacterota bacterium]